MPSTINFDRDATANSSGKILGNLGVRLKHRVFSEASVGAEIGKGNLVNSVHARSYYGLYNLRAAYVPSTGKILSHIEVRVAIADYALSEVKTAIKNILLEAFNYRED